MHLSDIYAQLGASEATNLFMGHSHDGIDSPYTHKVLHLINLGLNDLYHRFCLKKVRGVAEFDDYHGHYVIEDPTFIELIQIENIALKDVHFYAPNAFGLKQNTKNLDALNVLYQARLRTLTEEDVDRDVYIDLPFAYLNALVYFVGAKMYNHIPNKMDGDLQEGHRLMQKYFDELQHLTRLGIDTQNHGDAHLFSQKGFV